MHKLGIKKLTGCGYVIMFWVYWKEFYSHLLDDAVDQAASIKDAFQQPPMPTFMDQAWCMWHPIEGCVHFSDNWQQVSGQRADDCVQGKFFETIHEEDHTRFFNQLEAVVTADRNAEQKELGSLECRITQRNGDYRWFECIFRFSKMQSKDGHPLIIFAFRDIQKLVELKHSAAQATRESAFAEKGRRDFLTHMSHELRTPLNAILGFTQIIQSEAYGSLGNSAYGEYVEHIRHSGEELLNKINNLLELGNIHSEDSELREAPTNVGDILDEVISMHSHHAFERDIKLCTGHISPVVLHGDRARLIHAIANLLDNAVTYAPAGTEVCLDLEEESDGGVSIIISDNGDGIGSEQLKHMRDAFMHARGDHNPRTKGLGVGLLLANRVAHIHGGVLTLENAPQGGCVAQLTLPKERVLSRSARVKHKEQRFVAS